MVIATVTSGNYWPYTAVLLDSLQKVCPGHEVHVLGLDELPSAAHERNIKLLRPQDIWADETDVCRLRMNLFEWACASKARLLRYLLDHAGATVALYVDSDLEFHSPPDSFLTQAGDIYLTPNVAATRESTGAGWEREHLQYGAYNGGFVAVRAGDAGRAFLDWWDSRVTRYCCTDPVVDIFSDQRWLDLVPGLFPGVVVDRNPAFNVAAWNLAGRDLSYADGIYRVGAQPLVFFHYHRVRLGMDVESYLAELDSPVARELVRQYLQKAGQHARDDRAVIARALDVERGAGLPALVYRAARDGLAEGSLLLEGPASPTRAADTLRAASLGNRRLRARLRTLAYHSTHARATLNPGPSMQRYEQSWWYRLWIDTWYFWNAPRKAQIPVAWVSASPGMHKIRRILAGLARAVRTR